ncbi:phenylacetic acid degradation bifunctional protein PaaZ [Porticoccus sp. W117]|uniref:phenylacetic acid degradation bifunctional protein PaaZ n=1 Tax=Porticoccus sp. W117 TaxID=3054777 RepID=UPI00259AAD13|nr:phenylacetic acid degradation bifunctional protein PaaZ [Porticoccus sp. W117]MDM3872505.1 phenylacetic acid degradation bifunctional protein PaaZ [Porticoccus sp. W117]
MQYQSYVCGNWHTGTEPGQEVFNAITGESLGHISSAGIDFKAVAEYARNVGGPALRAMTTHERATAMKKLGLHLLGIKKKFYEVSAATGATKADSWIDIEGGIGTMLSISSIVRREMPNETFAVEGDTERLSANGTFVGRHILVPKEGLSLHINAFNFPIWGMLEKIAPSLAAGVPVIVKPATVSAYLTEFMVREIIDTGFLPEGSIQLITGSTGDLLDHLNEQDSVTFTGSAKTGKMLKTHPNIVENSIPFNMEADSLNCTILGETAEEDSDEFGLFIKEVVREMTTKAGQKCTAIRRILVPRNKIDAVADALKARLAKNVIGDPSSEGVRMGALVGRDQVNDTWDAVKTLQKSCDTLFGGDDSFEVAGADKAKGAFFPTTLLYCDQPLTTPTPHEVEAFGPVSTLMPYENLKEAIQISKLGKGSLVSSIFTYDNNEAKQAVLGTAAYHGRMVIINRDCAGESTGHGSPLAQMVHGGPGRAGGGEELGGIRSVKHYMQRTALQGSPTTLAAITNEYMPGAAINQTAAHPFTKYFEEIQPGDSLITHRRTVTEADIVNFGCLSGDHFYAHFDETAAADSLFGKRVAHGYFVLSAAAGLFVYPGVGPVLANYGLNNLRFIEPVGIGDTIQARLTCKQKIKKDKRPDDAKATGVVEWDVEVTNQEGVAVAIYSILTLVEQKDA